MPQSPTNPSTPRLSEQARHVVIPDGVVTTGWPAVKARGAELGFHYDPWQDGAGRITFGKRADGKYAATVGGVVWSIPRQVGKTFSIGSWLMILCVLFPGLKVIWTAHRLRTSTMTFRSMQAMAKRPKMAPHIHHVRTANGEQEIGFRNGSVILFGAREQGFGRGFEELDIEVFDEAQILTEKALDDMVPAANQARHPHGALLFFIGTPPKPGDPGEAFTLRRKKALSGKSNDMAYIEFSADPETDPDDRKQWVKANPSFPRRTPVESMLRMRENLMSDEAWRREALGIWDDESPQTLPNWQHCATSNPPPQPVALGIAIDPDRVWLSVAAASSGDTPYLGAVLRVRLDVGRAHVISEVARIQSQHGVSVILDKKGPAGSLIDDLAAAGVQVDAVGMEDYVISCGELFDAVAAKEVQHGDHPELNAAVRAAGWRKVGDRDAFARRNGDITLLEGAALALHAARAGGPLIFN